MHEEPDSHSRPRLTVRAAIIGERGVLVLKAKDPQEEWYVLPGGAVDENERVSDALHREMREELGIEIEIGPLVAVQDRLPAKLVPGSRRWVHTVALIFLAELSHGEPKMARGMDKEIAAVKWVSRENLSTIQLFPEALKQFLANPAIDLSFVGQPLYLETS